MPKHTNILSWLATIAVVACAPRPEELEPVQAPVPAKVKTPPNAPVVVSQDDAGHRAPALAYQAFLPLLDDGELRKASWRVYVVAEREARVFAAPGRWHPVREVRASDRALWHASGRIELPPDAEDLGAIAHELFHSAWHGSPFHAGADDWWGEGFCDAFRYFIEREHVGESAWLKSFEPLIGASLETVRQAVGDDAVADRYTYPATVIVAAADRDYEQFRMLWDELSELRATQQADVLDARFPLPYR